MFPPSVTEVLEVERLRNRLLFQVASVFDMVSDEPALTCRR